MPRNTEDRCGRIYRRRTGGPPACIPDCRALTHRPPAALLEHSLSAVFAAALSSRRARECQKLAAAGWYAAHAPVRGARLRSVVPYARVETVVVVVVASHDAPIRIYSERRGRMNASAGSVSIRRLIAIEQ